MPEIEMRKIKDNEVVQCAELRIPIEKIRIDHYPTPGPRDVIQAALSIIASVKKLAFEHLDVDSDNADYTSFEYKGLDGDVLVVEVAQVNV